MNQKSELPQSFCVRKLKVLAGTTRLAVLQSLMEEPKQVGELNAVIGLEQSLLSHHLKVLRQEGFVEATREGKKVKGKTIFPFHFFLFTSRVSA